MAAAHVVLGWSRCEDLALGRFFAAPVPRRDDVIAVVQAMESVVSDDPREVSSQLGFGPRKAGRIINLVRLTRDTGDVSEDGNPEQLVEAVVARAEAHRSMERSRVEMMRAYAETQRCRSAFVLGSSAHLGATGAGPATTGDGDRRRRGPGQRAVRGRRLPVPVA